MELRVKEICKEKGMQMQELADKLGITRITLTRNMSNIANGKTSPSLDLLERIAGALGVSVPELFAPQPTNTITCPHCGKLIKVEKGE